VVAVTTIELITVTPDPGGRAAAGPLARLFEQAGARVRGHRVVASEDGEVEPALRGAVGASEMVVVVGEGDGAEVARQVLGRLMGRRLVLSDAALDALGAAAARHGRALPRRAEALALIPQGATVLVAARGGEPGLLAEVGQTVVALLPADATAAAALAREHLVPRLSPRAGEVTVVRTLRCVGLDPGEAAARLAAELGGSGVTARSLEVGGELWVRLAFRAPTAVAGDERLAALAPALRAALGAAWYGVDDERLEVVVGRLLVERGLTVSLAESCTGGLVGHRLTDVAGSSRYFERGFVVYSNAAKQALLGVPEALLRRYGAVSAECAEAMARGARVAAGTDLAVSVTGIAGPDGGSAAKPVGTVFVGVADGRTARVERHRFDRDREGNKALSALRALDLLRRYVWDLPPTPNPLPHPLGGGGRS
jgi:nicotinamide-nucleotide amidase